jgi:glucosyl-3-phosphoglycerate phosphatase
MKLLPRSVRPRRLVLLRHGRTEWNRIGRAQGHADVPLDDLGVLQAATAATQLATYEPAFIWSSDLARARQTAEQVAALTGQDIVFDKRLREYDVGVRQGLTFDEFEQQQPEIFAKWRAGELARIPGSETDDEVEQRMSEVLADAVAAVGDHDTGIVVGHAASLRAGILAFFGAPAELREMLAGMANGAWCVLEQHPHRGWQMMDYNARTLPERIELPDDPSGR